MKKIIFAVALLVLVLASCGRSSPSAEPYNEPYGETGRAEAEELPLPVPFPTAPSPVPEPVFEEEEEPVERIPLEQAQINFPTSTEEIAARRLYPAPTPNPHGWTWQDVNMNGMGWVTGVATALHCRYGQYHLYARTDVGGAYRYHRGYNRWLQIMDGFGFNERGAFSVESIAVNPRNSNIVYIAANQTALNEGAEIWRSTDAGQTWEATGLRDAGVVYMGGNNPGRSETGERLTIDPNNRSVLYFASRRNGVWRNLGGRWEQIPGLPTETAYPDNYGFTFVALDRNSGTVVVDGVHVTRVFYVGAHIEESPGVFKTDDGGQSFTLMTPNVAFEILPLRGAVNEYGVFVTTVAIGAGAASNGTIMRGERGALSLDEVPQVRARGTLSGLAINAADNRFTVLDSAVGGDHYGVFTSDADGNNWQRARQANGPPVPYHTYTWRHPERGGFVIDPTDPTGNTAFAGTGFGIVRTENLRDASTVIWEDSSSGINMLVVGFVNTPPIPDGPALQVSAMDMGGFIMPCRDNIPPVRLAERNIVSGFPEWNIPLTSITGFAYSFQHPQYMMYTAHHQFGMWNEPALLMGRSRDGGATWEEIRLLGEEKEARGIGIYDMSGMLAMSSTNPNNVVWSPHGGPLRYSTDFGETWREAHIDPAVYAFRGQIGNQPTMYERMMGVWHNSQNLMACKIDGNVFYLLTAIDGLVPWFFRSTDGGATWERTYVGTQGWTDFSGINAYRLPGANIRVHPTNPGDVFVVVPTWHSRAPEVFVHRPLWRSVDGDVSDFRRVPGIRYAMAVTFGAGEFPDLPYIYVYGQAEGSDGFGVYLSRDDGHTWERITCSTTQQFGSISGGGLTGDMRYRELVYLYASGRGIIYATGPNYTGRR